MVNNEDTSINSDYEDTFNLFSKNNVSLSDYIDVIEAQSKKIKLLENNQKNMEIFLDTVDTYFTHLINDVIEDDLVKDEIVSHKKQLNNLVSVNDKIDLEEIDSFIQNKIHNIPENTDDIYNNLLNELRLYKKKTKELSFENKILNKDLMDISNKNIIPSKKDTVQSQSYEYFLKKLNNKDNKSYTQIITLLESNINKQNMYNKLMTDNNLLTECRTNLLRSDILQYFNTYNNNLSQVVTHSDEIFNNMNDCSEKTNNLLDNLENTNQKFKDDFEIKLDSLSTNMIGLFNNKIDDSTRNLTKISNDTFNMTKIIDKKSTDHFNLLINSIHKNTSSVHALDNKNYNKLNKAIEDNKILSEFYYNQQNSRSFKEKFMSKFPRLTILFRFKKFGFKNTLKTIRGYSKIKKERLFDVKYYICNNKYLSTMSGDPLLNYLLHEENWAKYPNNNFDPVFFRSQHKDMPEKLNALVYYSLYHDNFNWPTKK